MANKLTELAVSRSVEIIVDGEKVKRDILVSYTDLEQLIRSIYDELKAKSYYFDGGDMSAGGQVIDWSKVESVFSQYINLEDNG